MSFFDNISGAHSPIRNPRCDDFINFVKLHERNKATKSYICETLIEYKAHFASENAHYALRALTMVIDKVCDAYVTDRYDSILQRLRAMSPTMSDCKFGLNAIFEIYTDVVSRPR